MPTLKVWNGSDFSHLNGLLFKIFIFILVQKISPDTKEKIQLQLCMHDGSANTFQFANPKGKKSQKQDRETVKELLQQLLPKFRRKVNSELEEKNRYQFLRFFPDLYVVLLWLNRFYFCFSIYVFRILQQDPELFQLYKDLVVSGIITPEEFWSNRVKKKSAVTSKQDVGISAGFLVKLLIAHSSAPQC